MVPLEQENNLEIVRTYAILLREEVKRLTVENTKLKNLQAGDQQQNLNDNLRDQLVRLQKKFYGFGREELEPKKSRPVGHKQQELKLHSRRPHKEKNGSQINSEQAEEKKAESIMERIQYDFSQEQLEIENGIREIQLNRPEEAWEKVNDLTQDSVEITVVERTYKKIVHQQAKYRLKDEYNNTEKDVIITAPGPVKVKPGCQYSVDFAIAIVSDKYEFHLPLERQRRKMEAAGFEIDVKTLYGLARSVADHCDVSVISKIRDDILADFCSVHLDETPWPILSSKKRGQMWVLSNRIGSYYRFEPTRSGKIAEEIVSGYFGSVVVDGFPGYNRIKKTSGIRIGQCWAHLRREFYERRTSFPKEVPEFLAMIQDLYDIDDRAQDFDQLRKLRSVESKILIEKMYNWMIEIKKRFLPGDGIVEACNYGLKFWPELTLFLKDLSLPLDNNSAERAIRHAVMGRKNFSGSKTIDGADVAATLYTVIETCKKVGLDPREYLKYVITERWYGRDPKSPLKVSLEKFGPDASVVFPAKNEWEIDQ